MLDIADVVITLGDPCDDDNRREANEAPCDVTDCDTEFVVPCNDVRGKANDDIYDTCGAVDMIDGDKLSEEIIIVGDVDSCGVVKTAGVCVDS